MLDFHFATGATPCGGWNDRSMALYASEKTGAVLGFVRIAMIFGHAHKEIHSI